MPALTKLPVITPAQATSQGMVAATNTFFIHHTHEAARNEEIRQLRSVIADFRKPSVIGEHVAFAVVQVPRGLQIWREPAKKLGPDHNAATIYTRSQFHYRAQ